MRREQITGLCVLLLLTAGIGFAGSRRLSEAAERLSVEADYQALLDASPLAEMEGETVSPDGRFEIRAAGKSGLYVSGVVVPEALQVVDRESGEVLWEGEGMLWQSARWSPEGEYLALARSARTWCSVTVLETVGWTAWDFTLPDGSPIPEYTFLPHEDWGAWRSGHSLELALGRGGDEGQALYACAIVTEEDGRITGETRERTVETLPGRFDFNRDGVWERAVITSVEHGYTLSVVEEGGAVLWEEAGSTVHAGWTSIFVRSIDGADYLIRYLPTMYQGWAGYSLQVFSLSDHGEEEILHESGVSWDLNFGMEGHQYDPEALTDFLWEVHTYLQDSVLLMSTENGILQSNLPGIHLEYEPFGEALALDSRESLEEFVYKVERLYMQ